MCWALWMALGFALMQFKRLILWPTQSVPAIRMVFKWHLPPLLVSERWFRYRNYMTQAFEGSAPRHLSYTLAFFSRFYFLKFNSFFICFREAIVKTEHLTNWYSHNKIAFSIITLEYHRRMNGKRGMEKRLGVEQNDVRLREPHFDVWNRTQQAANTLALNFIFVSRETEDWKRYWIYAVTS